jgi:ABC-type lipoprotein export system ATPase subunit
VRLLVLERVWKRYPRRRGGRPASVALRDVSLEIDAGELVVVWGRRRSGRTTLLEVAAGIEPPTEGTVRFEGVDLARRAMLGVAGGIAVASTRFERVLGDSVLEQVAVPLLEGSGAVLDAQGRAHRALRRVCVDRCAEMHPEELDHTEAIRVAIARALVTRPGLLLVDEPTYGVPPARQRDELLRLLRSIAHDDGVAVLMTVDEATDLAGADRAMSIDTGEVRGETVPTTAAVVPLRRAQRS